MKLAAILALLLKTMPFLLVTLLSSRINLKRARRGRQFLMPVLAVLFCIPCMLLTDRLANAFVQAVYALALRLQRVPYVGSSLAAGFRGLYSTLLTGYGVQLLCNTVLMGLFCLIKLLALPILRRAWTEKTQVYGKTSGIFYRKNQLREKFRDLRRLFQVSYWTAVALGIVDCVLVLRNNTGDLFRVPFYPVFGIIVLGEISFFLGGGAAKGGTPAGDPEEPQSEPECGEIMEALQAIFGDRLGYSDQVTPPYAPKGQTDWAAELEAGDALSQVTAAYFTALEKDFHPIDPDYVAAADKLLHQKSVLIYNPFYRDLTDYVLLPVFHGLLNHHACLVICGRTANEGDIEAWLREGIQEVTSLPKLWSIQALTAATDGNASPDIGILGFEKLFDLATVQANLPFFRRTGLVILLEPSNILGTGQIGLRGLLQLCEDGDTKPTYLILDRNADGLVDALSHVTRQPLTEVIAAPTPQAGYCRAFWRAEGPGVQSRIFPNISHYMGIGGELAACALHEGASDAHWYSGSKMPLLDLRWNIGQYYPTICQYIDVPREQVELDQRLHFHESLWQANYGPGTFVLAEDEFCNAFEMERAFGARVRGKGIVNILSESYMLRDYMYDNSALFTNDPKAIPSIVPDYARTERNFVLRTLLLMSVGPMGENTLSQELMLHGFDGKQPYKEFVELVKKHTDVQNPRIQTVKESVQIGVSSCARFSYGADRELIDRVFDSALRSAYYIVEDEQAETYIMGSRLMDHVTLLPGQFFAYDGKYYQVKSISPQTGVILRRAADHIHSRLYYRPCRTYSMQRLEPVEETKNVRGIRLQKLRGDIAARTDGYLEMTNRSDLAEADYVELETARHRRIVRKEVLMATLQGTTPEVRFALCVLLNELFQTIYPSEKDYIYAVMPHLPDSIRGRADYETKLRALVPECRMEAPEPDSIYFIEDSNIDLGLLVSLERNFLRLLEILADYLDWYLDPADPALCDTQGDDVDGEDEELLGEHPHALRHFAYLTFGYDPAPEWLRLKETLEYLTENRYLDSNLHRSRCQDAGFDADSDYDPTTPGVHYCDFCGAAMEPGTYAVLKDGRERCAQCDQTAVKTRKQFRAVYQETVQEMERIFGIQLDMPIKVRMGNAKKVNEGLTDYHPIPQPDFRVLGYAQGNTILVENGAPLWRMKSTLVHELTHVWQRNHWNAAYFDRYKTDEAVAAMVEGMAVWAEIQYLLSMGEKERAIAYKRSRERETTAYGVGMQKFLRKYPPKEKATIRHSPFGKFPPV